MRSVGKEKKHSVDTSGDDKIPLLFFFFFFVSWLSINLTIRIKERNNPIAIEILAQCGFSSARQCFNIILTLW